jgi:tetratricopeptide (TPR) repeat protein
MKVGSAKILFSFLAILFSTSAFSQSSTPSELYNNGLTLYVKQGDKAYPIFMRAMQIAKEKSDWDVYIEALNRSSTLAIDEKGDFDKSFLESKEALTFVNRFKSRAAVAELHYNVGEFYSLNNGVDSALIHYEQAKQIFLSLDGELTKEVAKCYHGAGDVNKYNKLDFYEAENKL